MHLADQGRANVRNTVGVACAAVGPDCVRPVRSVWPRRAGVDDGQTGMARGIGGRYWQCWTTLQRVVPYCWKVSLTLQPRQMIVPQSVYLCSCFARDGKATLKSHRASSEVGMSSGLLVSVRPTKHSRG